MNLRNWTREHTKGFIIGVLTPLIFIPIVLFFLMWLQDYYFEQLWKKFVYNDPYRVRIITLSIISNLGLFYYFLNREKYNVAMGIIIGSIAYAPYVIYIKFF